MPLTQLLSQSVHALEGLSCAAFTADAGVLTTHLALGLEEGHPPRSPPPPASGGESGTHRELAHLPSVHPLVLLLGRDGVGQLLEDKEQLWAPAQPQRGERALVNGCRRGS